MESYTTKKIIEKGEGGSYLYIHLYNRTDVERPLDRRTITYCE